MKSVLLRAPVLSYSGYGQHSRQVLKYLLKVPNIDLKIQILQWGATPWMINPDLEGGIAGQAMQRSTSIENQKFDVSIQLQLPDEWSPDVADINIGMTAGVETDKCSTTWIDQINKMTRVIVPSRHVLDTFKRTGNITTPVDIVGESYIDEIDSTTDIFSHNFKTKFNFLIVSQITSPDPAADRKNTFTAVKTILETFKNDPDVGIILKANCGRGTEFDKVNTQNIVSSWIAEARKISKVPIYLVHGNVSNTVMASLYRHPTVKALVTLTRGEGFGLPILEAAAAGVPVIATEWSGHLDFLKYGKFIKINHSLINVPNNKIDGRIFIEGTRWAEPDVNDFIKKLKKFRESHQAPKEWAIDLSKICKNKFSQSAIESQYHNVIGNVFKWWYFVFF